MKRHDHSRPIPECAKRSKLARPVCYIKIERETGRTVMLGSGSAQRISHNNPVSGTSQGRAMLAICSMLDSSGLSPPCMHIILSSMTAVHGKQLKVLQNCFHIFTEKRRRHSS